MFIRPVSDIHNEFSVFNLPVTDKDSKSVLLLAGDIAVADRVESTLIPFLDSVTDRFRDILYIPGNHEYYGTSILRGDDKLLGACRRYGNVHFMQKKSMVIDDFVFIGATLWTDFNRNNPMVMAEARDSMNDYNYIRTGTVKDPYLRKLRPLDVAGINADHKMFIRAELEKATHANMRKVVFTHHGMSLITRHPSYSIGNLDFAYYNTGCEDMIYDFEPELVVHGHSHFPADEMMGKTRFFSNPRGYSKDKDGDQNLGFDRDCVIEL
jgi:hypothetical protein